jgi:methylmalonyl-CoA mutase
MNLLNSFTPVTRQEWLAQIEKDLKGQNSNSLDWQYNRHLSFSPTAASAEYPPLPQSQNWEIGEQIIVNDPQKANEQALEALQFGTEGLHFYLTNIPDEPFMEQLLQGVYLDFVGLHFRGPGVWANPGATLACLSSLCIKNNLSTQQLRGTLGYNPLHQSKLQDWRYLKELIDWAQIQFPGFQTILLNTDNPNPEEAVASLLSDANLYLTHLTQLGGSPAKITAAIHCQLSVGTHYLVEIAKIRAFKLAWMNWTNAWNLTVSPPTVSCTFQKNAYTDALYTNMIKATTMAMSAVLGGADQLVVTPYDEDREDLSNYPPQFARRIARNIQHLLKMESGFDQLNDPAAGSHYIEHTSIQIAEKSWEIFKNIQK